MKKIFILGILAILTTVAISNIVVGDDKTIDSNEFSFGDAESFVNMTMKEVIVGDELFNNEANIFVYNNATYDYVTFDLKGGQNPSVGEYLSEVTVDLGDNGRADYRFGGSGVGQWGNQSLVMKDDVYISAGDIFPSVEGDLYYIKLPSNAVVTSTSVNLTHSDDPVAYNARIPSDNNWARSYWYQYYYYGYSYFLPPANAGTYCLGNMYVRATDYTYASGYPADIGYLKWDIDDPDLLPPDNSEIVTYNLAWPIRNYARSGPYPGHAGPYHHGEMTYSAYAVESDWPTSYSGTGNIYYDPTSEEDEFNDLQPSRRSMPEAQHTVDEYHGSSSYDYNYDVLYDVTDLVDEWSSESLDNNGVMIAMDETDYCTGIRQNTGYSYYNNNANYYGYYYRGYMYSPGASSSYNQYKPYVNILYTLDSTDPWMDIGDDMTNEWTNPGEFSGTTYVTGWQNSVNQYLLSHFPDEIDSYGNEWTYIPVRIGADLAGKISVSDIEIIYDYTAKVYYNPITDSLQKELQSITPPTEEGWSLLELNVTSDTTGSLEFNNLKLMGEKPNYRPKFMEIPQIDTFEGIVDPNLLNLNDYVVDVDQDDKTLDYILQMNDQEHIDLYLQKDEEGITWLGIDTTGEENWNGEINCQISATDEFGKDAWTNEFMVNVEPVNDFPYLEMELPGITTPEGIDAIFLEYLAPSGRNLARGKTTFTIGGGGEPYFGDIEGERIYLDFELLGPDMESVSLDWSNQDGHKIYRGPDNEAYLTVLPPEYTDDPDNYLLVFGSEPDFTTKDGSYYLNVYASDDPFDLWNQTLITVEVVVQGVNDAPVVDLIPDILMSEDESYVSSIDFIEEYVTDVDTDLDDIEVTFIPGDDGVMVSLNEIGNLVIDLEKDFNGVVPIDIEVTDGESVSPSVFYVRIRSINDPPYMLVDNLYDEQIIRELYRITGIADDTEKNLRSVEIAVTKLGDIIYTDDWVRSDGAYVWQYLLDIRDFEEGYYLVSMRAFDGRDFSEVHEFNIYVEPPKPNLPSDSPSVTISTPLTGEISGSITVTGTVMDEKNLISFVEYRIDGGIWRKAAVTSVTEWQLVLDTKTISNAEHNLSVRAYDEKTYSEIVFQRFTVYNEDSDGDGIPNDLERTLLMDPFNKLDGTMDFDNDGFSNQAELMEHNTDLFDGGDHPPYEDEDKQLLDSWALIFIAVAILCAIVIIGLFILNIKLERNIHSWREDLNRRRVERKPKTLLQKIVEIAPTFIGAPMAPEGPALPGGQPAGEQAEALPPMQEGDMNPPA